MCVEILKKNMVCDMIKCLFHFYAIKSYFKSVLILILHFQNSHWGLTSNRMLTREIKLLGCPCDLMPERLLFLKFEVILFFSNYIYQKNIFTICILSENIFTRSLRFVRTLHSNIYQTQFPGKEISLLPTVVSNFGSRKL